MIKKILHHPGWIVAVIATLAAVWLHIIFVTHAGGLWRDEVAVANIARLPTTGQMWTAMPHDHCPVVFLLLVRYWSLPGPGGADGGLRVLGLCCGLLLLAAFWFSIRTMGRGLPLLSLCLAGLNFTIIRYGDSIRAYGLATALIIIAMALIWRFIESPNPWRALLAGILAVLSVQTLYQNAFFLLAICIAGMAVCIRRRQVRKAVVILGIGAAAALSLVPYISPICQAQTWWIISKTGITWPIFFDRMVAATGSLAGVWLVLPVITLLFGLSRIVMDRRMGSADATQELLLFSCIALGVGLVSFGVFIKLSGLPTQSWYYVPAMGFAVVCCDAVLPRMHRLARPVIIVAAVVIGLLAFSSAFPGLKWRQTNGDLAASEVSQKAGPGDLVIVHPWYYGLTFAYYYRGAAPWTTLPPLADYRFHRYDELKPELQLTNAIEPVLDKARTALVSGHRVWLVGAIPAPPVNRPPDLPPAPQGPEGWADPPYSEVWGAQLTYFLRQHITNVVPLAVGPTNVNPAENMAVMVARGWHASASFRSP